MNEQLMMLLSQLTGGGSNGMVRDVGEPKSVDDIINQSDIAEFLSKAMADKTNVESSEMPMREDITKYSSDDPLDLLFKMQSNQRREPSNIEGLMKILEDLSKTKPKTS